MLHKHTALQSEQQPFVKHAKRDSIPVQALLTEKKAQPLLPESQSLCSQRYASDLSSTTWDHREKILFLVESPSQFIHITTYSPKPSQYIKMTTYIPEPSILSIKLVS